MYMLISKQQQQQQQQQQQKQTQTSLYLDDKSMKHHETSHFSDHKTS